jgi:hypothetical protein
MYRPNYTHIRRTTICIATAIAICLPGIAAAGPFDKIKSRAQKVKSNAAQVVNIVGKKRPLANALQNAAQNLPDPAEIFAMLKELELKAQLQGAIETMRQMNADYANFPADQFRGDLKAVFDDYLSLAQEVPGLNKRTGLIDNIRRASNLVDYVPPRMLYLMSQTLGDQIYELGTAAENIRQMLNALPPFVDAADIWDYANMKGAFDASNPICGWVDLKDKPFVEWVEAELKRIAWILKTAESLIPNPEVKVEGGGEAGIAVVNAAANAGTTIKPLQPVHTALKVVAVIPEAINMAIEVNMARAKLVCAGVDLASNYATN